MDEFDCVIISQLVENNLLNCEGVLKRSFKKPPQLSKLGPLYSRFLEMETSSMISVTSALF